MTTTSPDAIQYSIGDTYAACHGTNHEHPRKIGKCSTCEASVVFYRGSLRDVNPVGTAASLRFVCWNAPHDCTQTFNRARRFDLENQIHEVFQQSFAASDAMEDATDPQEVETLRTLRRTLKAQRQALEAELATLQD